MLEITNWIQSVKFNASQRLSNDNITLSGLRINLVFFSPIDSVDTFTQAEQLG